MDFIIYEGKVALLLALFYFFYRALLSRETLHRLNRLVLSGSVVLSFVLPFCVLTFHRTVEVSEMKMIPPIQSEVALPSLQQRAAETLSETISSAPQGLWLLPVLSGLYFAGVAFCLVRIVLELKQVSRLIRSGEKIPQSDGSFLVIVDCDIAPFSWINWIVLSREDYLSENRYILEHEKAHIHLGHARDLLVLNILSTMQWFNPVMRMLKEDLRAIYEYEADDEVLRAGADIKEYQYSLIRKAVSASGYSITNSFNHSILKNRITMMSKQKSATLRGLRALYVVPLVVAGLSCNSQTVTDYKVSKNSQIKAEESLQSSFYPSPTEVILEVSLSGNNVEYRVDGEKVSMDGIGQKVLQSRGNDQFAYVSIDADPNVKSGIIQDVKNQLRKVDFLKVQYVCRPNVSVQRRLDPLGVERNLSDLPKESFDGDVQIRLNQNDRLLYVKMGGKNDVSPVDGKDLFAIAKSDIERNHDISFYFIVDRGSSFGAYSSAVQSVYEAYKAVREDMASSQYGKPFDELDLDLQDELIQKCKAKIIEIG